MASIVEVTQAKPKIESVTLKLTRGEATDLKVFISEWYSRNYGYGSSDKRTRENATWAAINRAFEGKADEAVVKVTANPFF